MAANDVVRTDPGPATGGLEVIDVEKAFETERGPRWALRGATITVPKGGFTSLIGPSGCGKSTLLRCAAGLITIDAGSVHFDGAPPDHLRQEQRIGFVPQNPALLPWASTVDNIVALSELGGATPIDDPAEWVRRVGLPASAQTLLPHQLSGGMKQRVALARAFSLHPTLLLMDEPFSALDEITRATVRQTLADLWSRDRPTVLFVTHSIDEAILLGDEVAVMGNPGQITASIPVDLERPRPDRWIDDPRFRSIAAEIRAQLGIS